MQREARVKRGRPKGRSTDKRSFGPLGDLIRQNRLEKKLGLLDVANACKCSVQFISNIEHGRAPLPWDKAQLLSKFLKIPLEDLQAANLAIRSDFQSFISPTGKKRTTRKSRVAAASGLKNAASLVAMTAQDDQLRELIEMYQSASPSDRKKFLASARKTLN